MAQERDNLTLLNGINTEYVAHLYGEYLKSPSKVDESWRSFFSGLNDTELTILGELQGASWTPEENRPASRGFGKAQVTDAAGAKKSASNDPKTMQDAKAAALDSIRALQLIRSYRVRGHLMADLDPLGLKEVKPHPELDPAHYGFTASDYNRPIFINNLLGLDEFATLTEIEARLKEIYCGKMGLEYMHLTDPNEKLWLQDRFEQKGNMPEFTLEGKKAIYQRIVAGEVFEQFLHRKFPGTKRFGVDGGEALIPCMEQIMKRGGQMGLNEINIGMAHRGRLNVLANVMGKPFTAIFKEFLGGTSMADDVLGSGDVKYHLGASGDRDFDGNRIHLSLLPNPSHLEFVNPIVVGKVRAKQVQKKDTENQQVLSVLLHGDAAFAGQGVTAETLMISELPGYRIGGTIHIVINNQIGFTTTPNFGRSGPYCTDVAKMLAAPIFHVNGDDPEAMVHCARLATEFRQIFRKDVVIDMFCYRRFGHNEGDEPAFTQPIMYKTIASKETTRALYGKQLVAEGSCTEAEVQQVIDDFTAELEAAFQAVESFKPNQADVFGGAWEGLKLAPAGDRRGISGVKESELKKLGAHLTKIPDGFNVNKKLERILGAKGEMFDSGVGFDWATAEAMAFGSLLKDGYAVRLSGQDVGRGTFSHRHAIWYDQETEKKYIPLRHVSETQPRFEVYDSPLSEMAVLGFEYGYTLADPRTLVLWEAQFGDFVNGAQVMIDQFISSGESKWQRMSGLVMLLPHGFEGQGPEHSSARPERFLQLCAEDNMQVLNCTTPANYFHALRRQMVRDFRKPLIIMTPKSLLRHKLAVSDMADFAGESTFHRVLWDSDKEQLAKPEKIRRIVLCTGKVYYDLLEKRRERGIKDVMIVRVEQLYPFPHNALAEELKPYKNAEVVWCQEEPKNQGYWFFVDPLIEEVLGSLSMKSSRPRYIGRPAAAAPATGLAKRHAEQQGRLVDEALA